MQPKHPDDHAGRKSKQNQGDWKEFAGRLKVWVHSNMVAIKLATKPNTEKLTLISRRPINRMPPITPPQRRYSSSLLNRSLIG